MLPHQDSGRKLRFLLIHFNHLKVISKKRKLKIASQTVDKVLLKKAFQIIKSTMKMKHFIFIVFLLPNKKRASKMLYIN